MLTSAILRVVIPMIQDDSLMSGQNPRALTIAAAGALLFTASAGLLPSGIPTLVTPFPFITVIPAFWLSGAYFLAVLIPSALFLIWNPKLREGQAIMPRRSLILFGAAASLSALWFYGGWEFGVQYQGEIYTRYILAINLGWLAGILASLRRYKRAPNFVNNLLFHWLLFTWLSWYAFPYLGELP